MADPGAGIGECPDFYPDHIIAKEYGVEPSRVRTWPIRDYQEALMILQAQAGYKITDEEIKERMPMAGGYILEHLPSYWAERTREQVTAEGYNADYVAEELEKIGLSFKSERESAAPVEREE